MIENVTLTVKEDCFVSYIADDVESCIPFSALKEYWSYASSDDFEGGFAQTIDDVRILVVMLVASGQGGIAAVWNTKTRSLEHVSQADYCEAVTVYDGYVYTLSVSDSYESPVAVIEKCKYGTKDIGMELETVAKLSAESFADYDGNKGELTLCVNEKGIIVFHNGNEIDIPNSAV